MKSHEEISQPFLKKAKCIEKNLIILKKEKLPQKLSDEISGVFVRYDNMRTKSLPHIEKNTGHPFTNPNLFLIVFLYKEISKIFNEVNQLVTNGNADVTISPEVLSEMLQLKENLMTLAFIGDSAIELGVIPSIWPKEGYQKIPKKGLLNETKKYITVGEKQSELWDFLFPEDEKILTSLQKSTRIKSSQFEAIFGIIYLEGGQDAIETAILTLKHNFEKKP